MARHTTTDHTETTSANKYTVRSLTFQIIDLVMGIITGVLFLRFIWLLAGANPAAGFVEFIYSISDAFMAPFRFIFPTTSTGEVVIDWSILVAIVVYSLGFALLKQLASVILTAQD